MTVKKKRSGKNVGNKKVSVTNKNQDLFKIVSLVFTIIFGSGIYWQYLNNCPILTLDQLESGSSNKQPFFQDFVLTNTGTRTAKISGIFIIGLKIEDIDFDKNNTFGPIISSVGLILNKNQPFRFNLNMFSRDIPGGSIFSRSVFKNAKVNINVIYNDTFLTKEIRHEITFSFFFNDGHWLPMGNFLNKNLVF